MKRITSVAILLGLALFSFAGNTIYVNLNAGGANNGTSWANAYIDLSQAFKNANAGDSVFVAKGTYFPTTGMISVPGPRDKVFLVKPGVKVYGGFAGTENTLAERNSDSVSVHLTNATVLSGDLGIPNDSSDNAYHVMLFLSSNSHNLIEGMTIAYGNADDSSTVGISPILIDRNYGGGIYIVDGELNIENCIIRNNLAYSGGAGIENRDQGLIILKHSVFVSNKVWGNNPNRGGGGGLRNAHSKASMQHVYFDRNEARDVMGGGAIRNDSASFLSCQPCHFNQNKATNGDGGGAVYNLYSSGQLAYNIFEGNYTNGQGGAMYSDHTDFIITDCQFLNNEGVNGGGAMENDAGGTGISILYSNFSGNRTDVNGGAIQNWKDSPEIKYCLFEGNTSNGDGGALYNYTDCSPLIQNTTFSSNRTAGNGGAIYNRRNCNPVVTNVLIHGNSAGMDGGGVYTIMSNSAPCSPIFTNTTITGNHADGSGGGAYDEGTGDPKLRNSIITGNTATGTDDIDAPVTLALTAIFNDIIGTDFLVSGSVAPVAVTGQIFADSANGDFRLADGCMAIDLGDSTYFNNGMTPDLSSVKKDLRNSDRIMGTNIDLGAMEVCTDTNNLSITLTVSPNDSVMNGTSMEFMVSWTGGGSFPYFIWYVNGQRTTNMTPVWKPVMGVDIFDGDNVSVEIVSSDGCDGTEQILSNVIVPRMTTGMEEYFVKDFAVYPNPTNGPVTLSLHLSHESEIQINLFDASGRMQFDKTKTCAAGQQLIQVETGVEPGLYLLQIKTSQGEQLTRHLIVH